MSCSICNENLNSPVSLPCGHVFCCECIRRTVDSLESCTVQHFCPSCQKPYCVVAIDPALVPAYLRPHLQPPIRPLFLNGSPNITEPESQSQFSQTTTASTSSPPPPTPSPHASPSTSEAGRTAAATEALRLACTTWRRRAEVHAAANAGLLGFARQAKASALRMRTERDAARNECLLLKRKLADLMEHRPMLSNPDWSDSDADSPLEAEKPAPQRVIAPARGLPAFVRAAQQQGKYVSPISDETPSRLGPPLKRRKTTTIPTSCARDTDAAGLLNVTGSMVAGH
ncbi:RING-type domain-containing protein [Favolaschia claudopus]|uniref:RING-type domain-containing protein n=1 Tax=Favolaschia claudopus TaxID=2862362 RepID=A0AAW0CB29_9AGAR